MLNCSFNRTEGLDPVKAAAALDLTVGGWEEDQQCQHTSSVTLSLSLSDFAHVSPISSDTMSAISL